MKATFLISSVNSAAGVTKVNETTTTIEWSDSQGSANLVADKLLLLSAQVDISNGFTFDDRNRLRFLTVNNVGFNVIP